MAAGRGREVCGQDPGGGCSLGTAALCGSLEEAYQFLRKRANLNDPDERLRLAEWCRQHDLREQASPMLNRATEQVSALAQRGVNTVRDTSQQLRDKALRASDSTVSYIKEEPVKAMLIAAATGAALMALVSLMGRASQRS